MRNTCNLYRLLAIAITILALSCPSQTCAQNGNAYYDNSYNPFEFQQEFYEDISSYHKKFPNIEFVYGNPNEKASGLLIVITPHPENASIPFVGIPVDSNDFRVWIDACIYNPLRHIFSLFHTDTQPLEYLDIRRKNTKPFALFISMEDIEKRVPRGYAYDQLGVISFKLRPFLAQTIDSKYPDEFAHNKYYTHPSSQEVSITYKPFGDVLQNKIDWTDDASRYMDDHPDYKYFFKREEVWQCSGWFFNMNYIQKNIKRGTINDSHYVIFTLWKDRDHTDPLYISYMKDNLFAGGAADDASRMEERFNYIAYPHKGFDDWSLFIPWECVDYWWKDGIKATPNYHTITAYFTLTLSNDGKTPANGKASDCSGELWLEKEVPEEPKECEHEWEPFKWKQGSGSIALPGGCTQDYDIYRVGEECKKCSRTRNESYHNVYAKPICIDHDLKEISRKIVDQKSVAKDGVITTHIKYEVWYQCQNDCCQYKEKRFAYVRRQENCTHDWKKISEKTETKQLIGKKEERKGNKLIITRTYLITTTYLVTGQCEKCKLEKEPYYTVDKKKVEEVEVILITDPDPPTCCPPHDWKDIDRKEIKRDKVIKDENCYVTVITYEVTSECQKECCKKKEPRKETEEIPHSHDWTYYSSKERKTASDTQPIEPYDKDSLNIDIDSTLCLVKDTLGCQDSLRMVKETHDRQDSILYVSPEPVSRQAWLAFNKNNNYMGFPDDDAGVLNAVTYQEAEDLIEKINSEIRKQQDLNVIVSLPSVEELRQLIKEDKVKFDTDPVLPLTYLYVDSIEVYDGKGQRVPDAKLTTAPEGAKLRIMVGRMNKEGEVDMVDIFTADPETGFILVAKPYASTRETTSVTFYRKYWRKCNTCGTEQLITENQFRNGRYHKTLIND